MDKLVKLRENRLLRRLDDAVILVRDEIRKEIEEKGWNEEKQTYTAVFGGEEVDASLLLLSKHEFEPADSPRMKSTYKRIREELGAGPGLVYRYRDGLSPGEGAFGICCFWAAEHIALGGGTIEEAEEEFRKVLQYRNELGLYGEEIDPASGQVLGNFPQGFTHVGLINAALTLAERKSKSGDKERAA